MMSHEARDTNRRQVIRLYRHPEHSWQLKIDDDLLITKNIENISPTGLSFKAPATSGFYRGQILKMNLSLDRDENFDCEGEVVWSKDAQESVGSMRRMGVRFSKLPARADSSIVQQINNFALKANRIALENGRVPSFSIVRPQPKKTIKSILITMGGLVMVLAATSALITVIYFHQHSHPEDSIEYKFNHAMIKKLINSK